MGVFWRDPVKLISNKYIVYFGSYNLNAESVEKSRCITWLEISITWLASFLENFVIALVIWYLFDMQTAQNYEKGGMICFLIIVNLGVVIGMFCTVEGKIIITYDFICKI